MPPRTPPEDAEPGMLRDPTPEEQAEEIVGELEEYIRKNRKPDSGVPFRQWQDLARRRIAREVRLAVHRAVLAERVRVGLVRLTALAVGAAVATTGFWIGVITILQPDIMMGVTASAASAGFLALVWLFYRRWRRKAEAAAASVN